MFLSEDCENFYRQMTADATFAEFIESMFNATCDTMGKETKTAVTSYLSKRTMAEDPAFAYASLPEIALGEKTAAHTINCKMPIAKRAYKYAAKFVEMSNAEIIFDVYKHRDDIEKSISLIYGRIGREHIRIAHSFEKYFELCDRSILRLYYMICFTDREDAKYPSLGNENESTMFRLMQEIRGIIEEIVCNPESSETRQREYRWAKAGLSDDQIKSISIKYSQLGHFPLFTAIDLTINSLKERDRRIVANGLNIYKRSQIKSLDEIASEMGITSERARQLKVALFEHIGKCISGIAGLCLDNYRYCPLSSESIRLIDQDEDTKFNENFIVWAACLSNSNLHLIGNPEKVFLKNLESRLFAVPTDLREKFNFDAFVESIDSDLSQRRDHESDTDLESYIRTFRIGETDTPLSEDILKTCKNIMEMGYHQYIRYTVHFPANAKMNIPDIIEEIIRDAGSPMTAEEIAEVFVEKFPDISQSIEKVRANARRSQNIATISRNSTYTLKKWADTPSKRGGTIRELAEEYLLSLDEPIARTADICRYVAQFRPDIKEPNLRTNLLLEATGKFSLYDRDGDYCIGLSGREYDPSSKIIGKQKKRLPFAGNINQLENFIKENGRFPFSSGVPSEEIRLNRFYGHAKSCLDKGYLSRVEAEQISRIDSLYGHLKVKKGRSTKDTMPEIA